MSQDPFDAETALQAALAASKASADTLLRWFRNGYSDLQTWEKSPGALVTTADLESDRAIADALKKSGARGDIISEESRTRLRNHDADLCEWLIDPLCGTVPFSTGMTHWGVNIAMRRNGHLELGVLSTPSSSDSLWAVKGKGVYKNGEHFQPSKPHGSLREVAIGLEIDGKDQWQRLVDSGGLNWVTRVGQVNSFSSAAYPMMQLCLGRLSGIVFYHIEPMHLAAGAMVALESGIRVTDESGADIDWSKDDSIPIFVAAWHDIHDELVNALSESNP